MPVLSSSIQLTSNKSNMMNPITPFTSRVINYNQTPAIMTNLFENLGVINIENRRKKYSTSSIGSSDSSSESS